MNTNNKTIMKKLLSLVFIFCTASTILAQDIITQNDGQKSEVKITELSDDYVKFYHIGDPSKVEIKMNRSLIKEIEFEYGRKEETVQPGLNESYFVNDHKNNIKLNFTAIANESTILTYERGIDPSSSWEGSIKLHGVGVEQVENRDKSGFGIEGAYKVKFGKLFGKNDYRPKHLLAGFSLKPTLGFSTVKEEIPVWLNGTQYKATRKYNYIHGGIDIGKQWILNNILSLEPYLGLNYYGGSDNRDKTSCETCDRDFSIDDGNMGGANNTAGRFGINIGFTF